MTGDLAIRKLLPALYELEHNNLLHQSTKIIGVVRREVTAKQLIESASHYIKQRDEHLHQATLDRLQAKLDITSMSITNLSDYLNLAQHLDSLESQAGICFNRLFYLAIPPQISMPIISHLGDSQLAKGCTHHGRPAQLLVEKPFGFDLTTAKELVATTRQHFQEEQIFRIDHYLAKETVQNIMAFRFSNPIFEYLWSNQHIQSIDIQASEEIGIEGRSEFYEQVGALRDLVQNHLLNMLSAILMPRPKDMSSSQSIHANRLQALEGIESVPADQLDHRVVRGQYAGYQAEVNNPRSSTETFVAMRLYSNDPTWENVPIYLRTGKALAVKSTQITIQFKSRQHQTHSTNQLTFHIQPNEGVEIGLYVKKPGFAKALEKAPMLFSYQPVFASHGHPDAYERVLVDAIRGDNTLFTTSKETLASWRILQPVLDSWSLSDGSDLISYPKGSAGPSLAAIQPPLKP